MNYYNEYDPYAAAWIKELVKTGELPAGDVDERSITEIKAHELKGYTQCHFFAGIGGWSLALRMAGWPDGRPVWTGSCPCQPFSIANKNGGALGLKDERHLWPVWNCLIGECRPPVVLGEQVPRAIKEGWLDAVFGDLEAADYACGALVLPANLFWAEHERKRLFWLADAKREGRKGHEQIERFFGSKGTPFAINGNALAHARRALGLDFRDILPSDGVSLQVERNAVKGYGNAIVPEVAARFIERIQGLVSV